nr:transposase [Micromonospora sp. KC721]
MVLPPPRRSKPANAAVVNYHHRLPLTQAFGAGTLSSSDGQRFPVKGKSITARHLSRYFARGQGVSTYTHVSDQHSTFDTKVIVATAPESHHVLDGLRGNETDLPVFEHATDTHGATLASRVSLLSYRDRAMSDTAHQQRQRDAEREAERIRSLLRQHGGHEYDPSREEDTTKAASRSQSGKWRPSSRWRFPVEEIFAAVADDPFDEWVQRPPEIFHLTQA